MDNIFSWFNNGLLLSGLVRYVLIGIIGVLIFQHTAGPLLVWFSHRIPKRYMFTPVVREEFFTSSGSETTKRDAELQSLGFLPVGTARLSIPNVETVFILYRHTKDTAAATLVHMSSKVKTITYLEFTQMCADGYSLGINSSPIFGIYSRPGEKMLFRYPEITSPSALWTIFRKLRQALLTGHPSKFLVKGHEFEQVAEVLNAELDGQVSRGFYKKHREGRLLRPTLKGAFLYSLKLIWPWKPLLNRLELRRAKRVLASIPDRSR